MPRDTHLRGRSGTRVISRDFADFHARPVAAFQSATCAIRHAGSTPGGVFDYNTGTRPQTPMQPYWSGPCGVAVQFLPGERREAGDELIFMNSYTITLPFGEAMELTIDDVIHITGVDTNGDPSLVGTDMVVKSYGHSTDDLEQLIHATIDQS